MKNFADILKESLLLEKISKIADPHLGQADKGGDEIAYDNNGDGWIVDAYCYADGGAPEGCKSLEDLLARFDFSGSMQEWLDEEDVDKDTFIVGAHLEKDEDEVAAWIWGPDGICYENK